MAQFSFDATKVAPDAGNVAPVPAGVYVAQVIESNVASLKSGNGTGLTLVWQILDGPSKGRRVWQALNVQHTNPEAERIAQAQLSAVCHAVGKPRIVDSAELHNRPCRIKVSIKKDTSGQYGDKNEVKGVEAAAGFPPAAPAANPAPAAAAPGTPPWSRRAA